MTIEERLRLNIALQSPCCGTSGDVVSEEDAALGGHLALSLTERKTLMTAYGRHVTYREKSLYLA